MLTAPFPSLRGVFFTLDTVAPNRSLLLVLTVGLLLGLAALFQAVSGGDSSDISKPDSSSSTSDQPDPKQSPVVSTPSTLANKISAATTSTTLVHAPPSTTSIDRPVSVTNSEDGVLAVSGYGNAEVELGKIFSDYRTVIYESEVPGAELVIELRHADETSVMSLGHSQSNSDWAIQGIRDLTDRTDEVRKIAVRSPGGWRINFLPEAFLWNQQIDAGNTPQPGDYSVLSTQGLAFVGSVNKPGIKGTGDLLIYNACQNPCDAKKVAWQIDFSRGIEADRSQECNELTDLSVKEVGTDVFKNSSPARSQKWHVNGSVSITLESGDWLEVLTPCQWSARSNPLP